MTVTTLFLLATLALVQPTLGEDTPDGERTPIRCRPAPYYIAERGERPKVERLMVTGSRVPIARGEERRTRPCHLMQAPTHPSGPDLRIAD